MTLKIIMNMDYFPKEVIDKLDLDSEQLFKEENPQTFEKENESLRQTLAKSAENY